MGLSWDCVFWVKILCSFVDVYQSFGETYLLYFTYTLKVKAEGLSEALANIHQITPPSNSKYGTIRHYFVPNAGNHPSDYNAQYLKEHNIIVTEVQTCDTCTVRAYLCTHIEIKYRYKYRDRDIWPISNRIKMSRRLLTSTCSAKSTAVKLPCLFQFYYACSLLLA